jgi:parallel beta-helix repeat protein
MDEMRWLTPSVHFSAITPCHNMIMQPVNFAEPLIRRHSLTAILALGTLAATGDWRRAAGQSGRIESERLNVLDCIPPSLHSAIAAGSSSKDVTRYLQVAIDQAAQRSVPLFLPSGRYCVSGEGVALKDGSHIIGAGRTRTLIAKINDMDPYVIVAARRVGVIIESLSVDGSRSQTHSFVDGRFGIYLTRCSDCRISNVEVRGTLADGIVIEYGTRCKVFDSRVCYNSKLGLYFSGSTSCTARGIVADRNGASLTKLGGGVGFAASWHCLASNLDCYGNTEADILLSRGSQDVIVEKARLSRLPDRRTPKSIMVLGETIAGVLHGVDYGDGSRSFGADKCLFRDLECHGQVTLEFLADSRFERCAFLARVPESVRTFGSVNLTFYDVRFANYDISGIGLYNSDKNGVVPSGAVSIDKARFSSTRSRASLRILDYSSRSARVRQRNIFFNGKRVER